MVYNKIISLLSILFLALQGLILQPVIYPAFADDVFPSFDAAGPKSLKSYDIASKHLNSADPNSNTSKDLVINAMKEDEVVFSNNKNKFEEIINKPIYFHFKGNAGEDIPKIEPANTSLSDKFYSSLYELQTEASKEYLGKKQYFNNKDPIPNCTESVESLQKYNNSKDDPINPAVIDQLFVRKGFLQKNKVDRNTDELFGINTRIFEYSDEEDNYVQVIAKSMNVPCLPFRVRISPAGIFTLTGKEALRLFRNATYAGKDYHPLISDIFKKAF